MVTRPATEAVCGWSTFTVSPSCKGPPRQARMIGIKARINRLIAEPLTNQKGNEIYTKTPRVDEPTGAGRAHGEMTINDSRASLTMMKLHISFLLPEII